MAIGDDWTIDYTNRMIYHDSGTTIYEMWELYSWLMDEIDESGTIDDTVPMTAQTPTAYTLVNSWYINEKYYSSFDFLKGGAIKTEAWDADTYNTGVRVLTFASGGYVNAVVGDIGAEVGYSGGTPSDTGTLLDYDNTNRIWWVRVDDTGDTFSNTATALDITNGTGTGAGTLSVASTTGEALWTNIYTLGTIYDNTDMYIYQNNSKISAWWTESHIDVLVKVKQAGSLINFGTLTIYARQYATLYENFAVDASGGGRIPIPIGTADDLNNDAGYLSMVFTTASGDFTVGEVIDGGTSGAEGIVTSNTGTAPNITLNYYLIGDVTVDFHSSGAETVTGATSSTTATSVAPVATGPNTGTPATITVTFAGTSQDLSNGNGSRPYSVIVDLLDTATVAEAYERLKYLTRRGETSDIDDSGSQTVTGEQYEAIGDLYIPYDNGSIDDPFNDTAGETITVTGSDFTGTLTSKHDQGSSEGFIIVRHVSGTTPIDGQQLVGGTSSHTADVDTNAGADPVSTIAQTNDAPFGTFAGGKFFGARGVFLDNVPTADATNYELIDSEGVLQTPPNNVPITVTGVAENTQCYVVDSVPTTYLNAAATTNVSGDEYQATTSLTYSGDISVTVRAREMGYLPFETSGTISDSGISVTAVWLQDPNFKFVVTGINIQFTNATSLITRASGNFTTDGWLPEMSQVTVEGSTNNDGTYTLSAIGTTTITISGASLTDEGPVAGVTLTFTRREPTW